MRTDPVSGEDRESIRLEPCLWHLVSWESIEATVQAAEDRIKALREALEEIMSPPDASRGCGDYGVCDLHEARWLAKDALHADDKAAP